MKGQPIGGLGAWHQNLVQKKNSRTVGNNILNTKFCALHCFRIDHCAPARKIHGSCPAAVVFHRLQRRIFGVVVVVIVLLAVVVVVAVSRNAQVGLYCTSNVPGFGISSTVVVNGTFSCGSAAHATMSYLQVVPRGSGFGCFAVPSKYRFGKSIFTISYLLHSESKHRYRCLLFETNGFKPHLPSSTSSSFATCQCFAGKETRGNLKMKTILLA